MNITLGKYASRFAMTVLEVNVSISWLPQVPMGYSLSPTPFKKNIDSILRCHISQKTEQLYVICRHFYSFQKVIEYS